MPHTLLLAEPRGFCAGVVRAISRMLWSSAISVTVSPAAGVFVVPLVTVPVMVAADAALANRAQSAITIANLPRGKGFGLMLIFL